MLISVFAFGGIPAKAIRKVFSEADIYISLSVLKEYRDTPIKLQEQKKITHQQLKTLLAGVAAFVSGGKLVHPTKKVTICRDAADNILLECCLAAHANIFNHQRQGSSLYRRPSF